LRERGEMATYAIIAPAADERLKAAIERLFPGRNFEFAPGQFVASSAAVLTAMQIGQQIGPSGEVGQFVVFSFVGHWGYHRKDLWEWLAVNGG
jgi:hypothetical protein